MKDKLTMENRDKSRGEVLYCERCNLIIDDELAMACPTCGSSLVLKNVEETLFYTNDEPVEVKENPLLGYNKMHARYYTGIRWNCSK